MAEVCWTEEHGQWHEGRKANQSMCMPQAEHNKTVSFCGAYTLHIATLSYLCQLWSISQCGGSAFTHQILLESTSAKCSVHTKCIHYWFSLEICRQKNESWRKWACNICNSIVGCHGKQLMLEHILKQNAECETIPGTRLTLDFMHIRKTITVAGKLLT